MKFIHFADAHLDSPFRGLSFLPSKAFNQIYQAADQSLTKIVDLALKENVDLVLIAGDTFDSNHPSPRSQLFFAKEIKRLTDAQIQVVMIFGNHDHMKMTDLLVAPSPYFKLLGNNEEVESAHFTSKNGFNYQVNGFSYLNNHITEDKMSEFPQNGEDYTFGIMHAQEKTTTASQNVYAPFSVSEIKALNYDYFALGHIHLRQTLSEKPWIVYPGNIQGRHINEMGAKGCYLGEINEQTKQTELTFYSTSPIIWQEVSVTLDQKLSKNDLQDKIVKNLDNIKQSTYFSLRVIGAQYLTEEEMDLVQDTDFWRSISMQLAFDSQLVDVRLESNNQLRLNDSDQEAFERAENEIFTLDELKKISKDWANKSQLTESLVQNPDFLAEVKELAKVKMASKLKGISDETETN
ncbi:DNA repair exonuclease [Lactobacillus hamsteri]|uniref:Phosphoesterase n=1 Tax=Lactobacillus hamsteri DSM 5661 = JCM 6256 TaxID=1423754 RepID=A0A0R1YDQ6_9LACO|nr:DNA repair exonuclease [Lactobacillus hamsteri]KRM37929.1 phosphoesterase [Lactobacillus hamsteri DSM 5661 = JCM 6256]